MVYTRPTRGGIVYSVRKGTTKRDVGLGRIYAGAKTTHLVSVVDDLHIGYQTQNLVMIA